MNGRETFKFAVRALSTTAEAILRKNNMTIDDVDYVVAHQANLRIIEAVADKLHVPINMPILQVRRCSALTTKAFAMAASKKATPF
jgi:3-oxoacyl-[acyl-carrier-protein] synthase-3